MIKIIGGIAVVLLVLLAFFALTWYTVSSKNKFVTVCSDNTTSSNEKNNKYIGYCYNWGFDIINSFVLNYKFRSEDDKFYLVNLAKSTTFCDITIRVEIFNKDTDLFLDSHEFMIAEHITPNSKIKFDRIDIPKFDKYHSINCYVKLYILSAKPAN